MIIKMEKFGQMLISRTNGREAWLAAQAYLLPIEDKEEVVLDFEGVAVLAPSWADEFITKLKKKHPNRIKFTHTDNSSVKMTLKTLEKYS